MINQVTEEQINHAKVVLENHVVDPLTRAGALEAGLFCIASQAMRWEAASRFIRLLRQESHPGDQDAAHRYASVEVLNNKEAVNQAAKRFGWRYPHQDRFGPFIDYFGHRDEPWWKLVRSATPELRARHVSNIAYLGCKTYSFWSLCLGGTDLLALDVHVMRGLKELGLEIDQDFITAVGRADGQSVRKTPPRKEYLRIEGEARELFAQDRRFVMEPRMADPPRINLALVDSVLWWRGANRGDPCQGYLFGEGDRSSLVLPYTQSHLYNPPEEED